jgi:hypothetical protein
MKTAVKQLHVPQSISPTLEYGEVAAVSENQVAVLIDGEEYPALIAASCLLRPSPGDRVLVSLAGRNDTFLLAVLERGAVAAHGASEISLAGDVTLSVRKGALRMNADDGIHLATRHDVSVLAKRVELNAAEGTANLEKVSFSGRVLECSFESVRRLAGKCEEFFGRLSQKCGSSTKMVEQHEEVQAGSMRHVTDGTMTMQSRNMIQTAEENVRIDAEKIHLG